MANCPATRELEAPRQETERPGLNNSTALSPLSLSRLSVSVDAQLCDRSHRPPATMNPDPLYLGFDLSTQQLKGEKDPGTGAAN